jgi:hypothetical protein
MNREKQIEFERNEMADILAQNFRLNDEQYDPSDFEWSAHCLQMAGFHKQSEGEWEVKIFPLTRDKKVTCSCCGYSENRGPCWDISWGMHKFCPNCGAKMKGENNEQRETD